MFSIFHNISYQKLPHPHPCWSESRAPQQGKLEGRVRFPSGASWSGQGRGERQRHSWDFSRRRMTFSFMTLRILKFTPYSDPGRLPPILWIKAAINGGRVVPVRGLGDTGLSLCVPNRNNHDIVVIQAHFKLLTILRKQLIKLAVLM